MPATQSEYDKIKQYQEQAASLTEQGTGLEASAGTLSDDVMKAVREARAKRGVSKMATDVGTVTGQLVSDPTGIRSRTSGVVDPFSVNALTANARASNLSSLATLTTQQSENEATTSETIQAGANKLKAQAATLYAQAQQAQSQADALQQEWERGYKEKELALEQQKAAQTASGGSLIDNIALLGSVGGSTTLDTIFTDPNQVAALIANDPKNATKYTAMAALFKGKVTEAEAQKSSQTLLESLTDIQTKIKGLTGTERAGVLTPFRSQNVQDVMTGRNIVMQQIAKLIEKTRLSDKDRDFYMANAPSDLEIMLNPSIAVKKMNSLVDYFRKALNVEEGDWE